MLTFCPQCGVTCSTNFWLEWVASELCSPHVLDEVGVKLRPRSAAFRLVSELRVFPITLHGSCMRHSERGNKLDLVVNRPVLVSDLPDRVVGSPALRHYCCAWQHVLL